jgi:hypothetical protein
MRIPLLLAAAALAVITAAPSAQSDLDRLMRDVLARRDDNWKKLQQYTLTEQNTFRLAGPMDTPLYGARREYRWFPREGFFVRSPVNADGVAISDKERRKAEDDWLKQEQDRERRRAARRGQAVDPLPDGDDPAAVPDVIRQTVEPGFVSAAYFLRFRFERGQYALVGREQLLGRSVLRIEYYPEQLFRTRPRAGGRESGARDEQRPPGVTPEDEARIAAQMNKVSLVTLWVDPDAKQILRYQFQNVDADFLPGRWLARLDALTAEMQVGNPFPEVWLPASLNVRVALTLAIGHVTATYDVAYRDYRLAETGSRVVP